ncbi:hypothetical protein [Wolbachia endosymbiont of Ctenocephalides felis wCfeT]|uniref:hypothetical protein n=1 Tax=Wolbachia endosymbiont of Ctenocephalides felis wCfeT TaxID=2732593 RepID=UPI001444FAAA|nr:hypothetical protein [Wolbachia endosymbiont of Ctenocephalides felis wCfeT]
MSFKLRNVCLVLSVTILLTGCFATIFSGSTQGIKVKVTDDEGNLIQGVRCVIQSASGASNFLTSNPGVVIVQRGSGPLSADCQKSGYKQLHTMVGDSFNGITLLNMLWLPGFAIDAVTGAYKKYPSHYVVVMEKSD